MKTEEERIESIVDELQSQPLQKYDVRTHIALKKTPDEKQEERGNKMTEKKSEQYAGKKEGLYTDRAYGGGVWR